MYSSFDYTIGHLIDFRFQQVFPMACRQALLWPSTHIMTPQSDGTNSNNAVTSQKRRLKRGPSIIVNAVDSFDAHGSVSHTVAYTNNYSLSTESNSRLYLFRQEHRIMCQSLVHTEHNTERVSLSRC